MICFYPDTSFISFFSIYILIPLSQISETFFSFFIFILDPHRQPDPARLEEDPNNWELDLPVTQFQDGNEEEMCSICLVEFEEGDMVNKVTKCGHVFHVGCLERWLDTCRFTCPLCRCLLLCSRSSPPCMRAAPPFCINLPPQNDAN